MTGNEERDDDAETGKRSDSGGRADALVMFGLTGDLGDKKLFPALYELAATGRLGIPAVGIGRSEYSNDDMRSMLEASLDGYEPAGGDTVDPDIVASIDVRYLSGDSTEPATYDDLVDLLDDVALPVVYAALPPDLFGDVARGIAQSRLPGGTRLVVEKPFGDDAESARRLHDEMTDALGDKIFIVDHFLAKSAIENMLTVRTSNALIHNSMCAQFVDSIEIAMKESGSLEGRGSFYEGVGAVDDVLQNHLLQTLAYLLMDAPADADGGALHQQRMEFLGSVAAIDPSQVVLGQYAGYRDHDDVADDSNVETYVDVQLHVENDRWRGVPIRIRSGKQLGETSTVATIRLADTADGAQPIPNEIRFHVKPDPHLEIDLGVLDPETHEPTPVVAELRSPVDHGTLGDYATMLDNALNGDAHHFAHIGGIIEAWRIVEHVKDSAEVATYEPGSDGP